MKITRLFLEFIRSKNVAGLILILCSVFSLVFTNTGAGEKYLHFWHSEVGGKELHFWINDGLMTIFFLLIGLEIEREFYIGELSNLKKSMLPVFAAAGGMLVPALIHAFFNHGTITQQGFGIPMATDIAFSLAVLALLGSRVPTSLKIFLTALAIIDDLGAIIVIALFYSTNFSIMYFGIAMGIFALLVVLNRLRVHKAYVYLILGCVMWYFMYRSGIHPTITGVLLAFALPFEEGGRDSVSYKLQHRLHLPVALLIVPLFALANTAIPIHLSDIDGLLSNNSLGIMLGLAVGKPLGIIVLSYLGIMLGICTLPLNIRKRHLLFAGMLAGIGFTMSIFITLLAFHDPDYTNSSKIAIIIGSTVAGLAGYFGLRATLPKTALNIVDDEYEHE